MSIIKFAQEIGLLKKVKRAGWIREYVKDVESVSDHSYRLAILAMVLVNKLKVEENKFIKMAMIHDLGEIKTGDIIIERWGKGELKVRKKREREERKALEIIFDGIDGKVEYLELFDEYTKQKTKEAKLLRELDKLETAIKAYEYEKETGKDLSEFFVNAKLNISNEILKKILTDFTNLRKTRVSVSA